MSELWEDQALSAYEAWQAPPRFLEAPSIGCVCVDGALYAEPVVPYPVVYDQLGLIVGSTVVGLLALRALRGVHRQVAHLEVEDVEPPTLIVSMERTRSGVEAKADVEAHTKKLGRAG